MTFLKKALRMVERTDKILNITSEDRPRIALSEDRVGAGMQRWRREFPDIDCSGKAIVGRLLHLHDVLLNEINRALAPHGLKYPAYAILATLRVNGAPYQMSPKSLLNTLILTSGGLSNLLRRLEADGLIHRTANDSDGRGVVVELTKAGKRRVEPAMRDHAAAERRLIASLSRQQQNVMSEALKRMMPGGEPYTS